MARPQSPITVHGPVADLARALRAARERAGTPPPTYRKLAAVALRSASVLADAASGHRCPTWEVTESFLRACGADPEAFRRLWSEAARSYKADRKAWAIQAVEDAVEGAARKTQLATVRPLARRPGSRPASESLRSVNGPNPRDARTPAEYVYKLRALRAWAGQPGWPEMKRYAHDHHLYVSRSSIYKALSPTRTTLPKLEIVEFIVDVCHADPDAWVSAWRTLMLRVFEATNPAPASFDQQEGTAGEGGDADVVPLAAQWE